MGGFHSSSSSNKVQKEIRDLLRQILAAQSNLSETAKKQLTAIKEITE